MAETLGWTNKHLPQWEYSLDALCAKGGPVEWCVQHGYEFSISINSCRVRVTVYDNNGDLIEGFRSRVGNIADPLFRACCQAMGEDK
jgi:hypothetical protein